MSTATWINEFGISLAFDPNEPRDELGRWTNGGSIIGHKFKHRGQEWTIKRLLGNINKYGIGTDRGAFKSVDHAELEKLTGNSIDYHANPMFLSDGKWTSTPPEEKPQPAPQTPAPVPAQTPVSAPQAAQVKPSQDTTNSSQVSADPEKIAPTPPGMTSEERAAIKRYKGVGYTYVNAVATGNGAKLGRLQKEEGERLLPHVASAVEKSSLVSDATLYRAVPSYNAQYLEALSQGDTVSMGHFVSTSTKQSEALNFMIGGKGRAPEGVMITIKAPKGTKGLAADKFGDVNKNESEIILNKGLQYKVNNKETKGKVTYMELEVVPQHTGGAVMSISIEGDYSNTATLETWASDLVGDCLLSACGDDDAALAAAEMLARMLPVPVGLSVDAEGHQHKGKGPGGGQFTHNGHLGSQDVYTAFGHKGEVEFKTDTGGKAYGEHGLKATVVNPHLATGRPVSLNFKPNNGVTEARHLAAHELVHQVFSEHPESAREAMESLKNIKGPYGSAVSMYGSFEGAFENVIELGAAYSHSPQQLNDFCQEMFQIAKRWADKVKLEKSSALSIFLAHDIYNRQAQGILNRSLQVAKGLGAAARKELANILKRSKSSAKPLLDFIDKYRVQLAKILAQTQIASMLEGAREVADKMPTLTDFPGAIPPPPTLEPQKAVKLVERLEAMEPVKQAEKIMELKPAEQVYVNQAIAARAAPPPSVPPIVPQPTGGGAPEDVHFPIIDEAVRNLAERNVMTRDRYDAMEAAARAKAFTVANVAADETLTKIRDSLAKNVEEGADYETWRKKIMQDVDQGTFMSEGHQENVFRTNVQTAFSDGQESVLQHPLVRSGFPYRARHAIHDERAREEHLKLEHHGIGGTNVYRADDPVWQMFRTPWAWNCRCNDNPLTVRQAAEAGVEEAKTWLETGVEPTDKAFVAMPDFQPPPGFQRSVQAMPLSIQLSMQSAAAFGFDPNEPRDAKGEWTSGGGDYGATTAFDKSKLRINHLINSVKKRYPKVSGKVGGLDATDKVDNRSSIASSIENYEEVPGIRSVSMDDLQTIRENKKTGTVTRRVAADDERRVDELAAKIKESGKISPLILVEDGHPDGPYILEGGHRIDALERLGVTHFPAKVVIDLDSIKSHGRDGKLASRLVHKDVVLSTGAVFGFDQDQPRDDTGKWIDPDKPPESKPTKPKKTGGNRVRSLFKGMRANKNWIPAVALSVDAVGHEHKGKGPGGGEFTSKGAGGNKTDKGKLKKEKGPAPGSQIPEETRNKLRETGMVGSFPPADVKIDTIKINPKAGDEGALMSWDQTTKSGRISRQYRYTQVFIDRNSAQKHERVVAISPHIDKIQKSLAEIVNNKSADQRQREAAAIANVIRETGLRPTDGDDSVAHGHFGISSLQARHVKVVGKSAGDEVHLDFIGKEGVRNKSVVRDQSNVSFIKEALGRSSGEDFIFQKANSNDAGAILKEISSRVGGPSDIKIKDLRTLKAHQIARDAVMSFKGPPPPLTGNANKDKKLIQSAILSMAEKVSTVLNNQPTESRDTYVHPEIWKQWQRSLQPT